MLVIKVRERLIEVINLWAIDGKRWIYPINISHIDREELIFRDTGKGWIYPVNISHIDREELIFRDTGKGEMGKELTQQMDPRLINAKKWIQHKVTTIL